MWKMVKLGDVCKITNGSTPLRKEKRYWAEGNIPWFTIDDLRVQGKNITYTKQNVTQAAVDDKKVKLVPVNSVLLCCTASIGAAAITRVEMATNQQFNALTPKSAALNSDYLYFVATTLTQTLLSVSGSTTINFVSMSKLKEISIPLPPLPEQERIVAKLDAAFARIDEAINATTAKETEVQMLKVSMLSSSLNGDAVMWTNRPLGEVCEILNKLRKPITKRDRKSGEIPYYGATGVVDRVDDFIFNEKLVLVGEDGAKWKRGDKTAFIINGKAWVNNHAHVLRPYDGVLIHEWLEYYLTSIDLSPWVHGATVPKLNQTQLRSIPIPIPPLGEQERIVARLDEAFSEFKNVNEAILKSKANYLVLKSAILSKELQSSEAA